jgi:hypothetical protein
MQPITQPDETMPNNCLPDMSCLFGASPNTACTRPLNRGDFPRWYAFYAFPLVNRFARSGG